jgi:O-antigen/teichoic acid export membrane protein
MTNGKNPYEARAVRSGISSFLLGRGVSAVVTFLAFALAARALSLGEYGIYTSTLAVMEVGLALASFGIDWVAIRVVPEYRVHASGPKIVGLILGLVTIQALLLIIVGASIGFGAGWLATMLHMESAREVLALAGLLLSVEGVGRLLREQMLGILMLQRSAQLAQILRSTILAAQIGISLWNGKPLLAHDVVVFELIAASASTILGAFFLAIELRKLNSVARSEGNWTTPSFVVLIRLAAFTYASYLLTLPYGGPILTMIIARWLGPEAAAIFGFSRTFADQVRKYLPTDLLQGVLRPAIVAFYSSSNDFDGLMLRLAIWLKSSLIVLLPVLAFFLVFGDVGAVALGGKNYGSAWPVLAALLVGAGAMAWRRVTELACNTALVPEICTRSSLLLLLVPVGIIGVVALFDSLFWAVVLLVAAELIFCFLVLNGLRGRGFLFRWPIAGFFRIGGALILSVGVLTALREMLVPYLVVSALFSAFLSLFVIRLVYPFDRRETDLLLQWMPQLNRLLRRTRDS